MKRRIVGGLLVGLPLAIFFLLVYLTGAWEAAIVLGGVILFSIMIFCVVRGVQLLEGWE